MKAQSLKLVLLAVVFFAIPVLYAFEINYLNRTLHARQLLLTALVIGWAIGSALGFWWQKKESDSVGKIRIFAACLLLSALVLPLGASMSNRLLSFQAVHVVQVEFVEESPRFSSRFGVGENAFQPTSYLTFFYLGDELLKIQTSESLFPNAKRGDLLALSLKKGFWGFELVFQ